MTSMPSRSSPPVTSVMYLLVLKIIRKEAFPPKDWEQLSKRLEAFPIFSNFDFYFTQPNEEAKATPVFRGCGRTRWMSAGIRWLVTKKKKGQG